MGKIQILFILQHIANTQICGDFTSPVSVKNTEVIQNNVTNKIKFIPQEL